MRHLRKSATAAIATVGLLTLGACGDDDGTSVGVDATTETTAAASSSNATETAATVDANTASIDELAAAFEAAGIPQAERWAREVDEYRPYPTDDSTFAKLRDELSKYNPSDAVVEAIIATLTL